MTLYDRVIASSVQDLREKIKEEDACSFRKRAERLESELSIGLSDEQKLRLNHYRLALEDWFDEMSFQVTEKVLYWGIKMGMELQSAFQEDETF